MRILFRRSRPGLRPVTGGTIREVQNGLADLGFEPGAIDGIFGGRTETALKAWQAGRGAPDHGAVDEETWTGLTGREPPSPFERCLALTAAFEGHGYTLVAGNFDGAYLTWGIIGFTLKHGNLARVVRRIEERHPHLLDAAFGARRDELLGVLDAPAERKRQWADGISIPPRKYRVREDWATAFAVLGTFPEVQAIQREVADEVYWRIALRDFRKFGLADELDLALCFDTAVQNGGINATKERLIRERLAEAPAGIDGEERRVLFADAIADGSSAAAREDVRARRLTIARGTGRVHAGEYAVRDWGLDEVTVGDGDLERIESRPVAAAAPPERPVAPAVITRAMPGDDFAEFIASLGLRHFKPYEFLLKGPQHGNPGSPAFGLNTDPPPELWPNIAPTARVLDALRREMNLPIQLTSVYRSPAYNHAIGGAAGSQHTRFTAADFVVAGSTVGPSTWARRLREMRQAGLFSGGIGVYAGFVHVDTRGTDADWMG